MFDVFVDFDTLQEESNSDVRVVGSVQRLIHPQKKLISNNFNDGNIALACNYNIADIKGLTHVYDNLLSCDA